MQQTLSTGGGIRLRDVLPQARFSHGDEVRIQSCCSDWRACRPGDLFVALVRSHSDGHDFADRAVRRGAVAVLAERPLPVSVPTCVVDDTRVAHGQLCQALAGHPSRMMHVVGIGGTYGKTCTSMLAASIFEAAGHGVGILGSLGYCDAVETAPATDSTPVATELADWLARMTANGCTHAVIETSSRALAEHRTAGVEVDVAVLTNLRRQLPDLHGSGPNYRQVMSRLFRQLSGGGVAVINVDDPVGQTLLSQIDHPVMTVAIHRPAELTAEVIERHGSEQTFLLTAGADTIPVRTHLIGDHQIYNCLAAAAAGLVSGLDLTTVVRGLESVRWMPGRLERIECGQGFGAYVDVARTPESLATALRTLRGVTRGRIICVFGAQGGQDPQSRPLLGRAAERYADVTVITSDNPGPEEPLRIAHDILDGCRKPGAPHIMPNRAKAIQWALASAAPGDSVLVAGKGCDQGQVIGGRIHAFDDREVVRYCLYQLAPKP